MDVRQTLEEIVQDWFLGRPLFLDTYCTHVLRQNSYMRVPFRTGRMRIEYNPDIIGKMSRQEIKKSFETEIARILLKHPYHRQPDPYVPEIAYLASDMAIHQDPKLLKEYDLPPEQTFEKYYYLLLENSMDQVMEAMAFIFGKTGGEEGESGENGKTGDGEGLGFSMLNPVGLWTENMMTCEIIKGLIQNAMLSANSWGDTPEYLKQMIIASIKVKVDYKKVLRRFRTSVISSSTVLTRLKPSRRSGFEYMGKKSDFTTSILIAVDVSGSISDRELNKFFSAINNIFKYGVKSIDVIDFDTELKGEPESFTKKQEAYKICGRGGTNFQAVFDYIAENPRGRKYDGVIIFTDGYAPVPERKPNTRARVCWVCTEASTWDQAHEWMETLGSSCYIEEI